MVAHSGIATADSSRGDGAHDAEHDEKSRGMIDDDPPARPNLGRRNSSWASMAQIEQMVSNDMLDTKTYGVSELREGFFDAFFLKPTDAPTAEDRDYARTTLPKAFDKGSPLSPKHFCWRQAHELRSLMVRVTTTRAGIRLLKSCTAFLIAYILCLVPVVREWLGRYSYIMAVSVILNHPARTVGSQIDGAFFTIIGTVAGLGWGTIALLLSNSTIAARAGFGGVLAAFMVVFMGILAWIRSTLVRFHQANLCAGIAITITILAETQSRRIVWRKLFSYGVSWLCGQAISLVVCCIIFPDAGARPLSITLHKFFAVAQEALVIPRPRDVRLRRTLARMYVELSVAYRDLRIDMSITRFRPDDIGELRNLMQTVIRTILSMETETLMFDNLDEGHDVTIIVHSPSTDDPITTDNAASRVARLFASPTRKILDCLFEGLARCDAAIMELSGYRNHLGPPPETSSDLASIQTRLKNALASFDAVEHNLLNSGELPASSIDDADVIPLFLFSRHVRETAAAVQALVTKIEAMQGAPKWPRVYLPSYPFRQAIHRTNRQVRHDRGGITAASYHTTFSEIAKLLEKIKSRDYRPPPRTRPSTPEPDAGLAGGSGVEATHATMDAGTVDDGTETTKTSKRYKVWKVLHRLQGFESRYAFKVCLVTSLLSVPSYLQGTEWWDEYEAWWVVAVSWIMIHPRVGGNLQDLVTRASVALLGAVWAGAGYAAGDGSPYVLAVFAIIYMVPMLYRFTQSSHPRSGLVGCLSFTVVSLSLKYHSDGGSVMRTATLRGLSFLVGTVVPIVVNWVLWPFVARHELRHALSSMLFFMSIIYRSVVAKYVYFDEGHEPTPEDIARSEMLEGRLREGFVRIRQLLVLTRHEIRLRGKFDPLPYSALTDSLERFFEYLIAVRQSALFYNPEYIRDDSAAAARLLGFRRDAVAAILGNLYILAGALRSQRKVPRYMPSAAAARKKLLFRTMQFDDEMAKSMHDSEWRRHKQWSDIYSYSYKESLTGCVAQLEELERYTKLICGVQGFDDDFEDENADDS